MDEEELMPGIDGQTFEIRLGEEFRVQDEVIPAPQEQVEVENDTMLEAFLEIQNERIQELNDNGLRLHEELAQAVRDMPVPEGMTEMQREYVRDLENYIQQTREQALNTLGITVERQGELRPIEDQPLANLPVQGDLEVQGQNGEFTYNNPFPIIEAERRLEQLRGMAREAGMIPLNTQRPPVENIQELNLQTEQAVGRITREHIENAVNTVYRGRDLTGNDTEGFDMDQPITRRQGFTGRGVEAFTTEVRETPNVVPGGDTVRGNYPVTARITSTPRRAGATQARPVDDDLLWAEEAVPTRAQRVDDWGTAWSGEWRDPNEERIRKVENLKKELMEFIETLEESDSIKKIQEYVDRY